ncbi:Heat shock factor-binding protein [Neofusicoccum parvum]|uniref:Putative heat shock factor-binding protein n=1 Tax=Botryosphaeria parva (strain UCR-NP2) TaxID=1287680 RepID=R1GFL3_BOTPV|nr:putative heat shock factor-binding protein [Neofusicoccum parvum UCRNP2]GME65646.1 Heat shock factor-binding protein [Neofusicoccum parvum]
MSDRADAATPSSTGGESSAELVAVVDDLINQLSSKFTNISKELLEKMDDMSRRLDTLETTIQTGAEPKSDSEDK